MKKQELNNLQHNKECISRYGNSNYSGGREDGNNNDQDGATNADVVGS